MTNNNGESTHLPINEATLDADVALITDYLVGDLAPEGMVDVHRRLLNDEEFRENVGPIIDVWRMPVNMLIDKKGRVKVVKRRPIAMVQAECDRIFRSVGMAPIPLRRVEKQLGQKVSRSGPRRWLRRIAVAIGGLVFLRVAYVLAIYLLVRPQLSTFQEGAAADTAGRSLPPGGTIWKSMNVDTKPGEERVVPRALIQDRADVTLFSDSRLTIGTQPYSLIGAPTQIFGIDGAAWVTVLPRKVFTMNAGDVLFVCVTGRFHVAHPLHGPTQIFVERGHVWLTPLRKRTYGPGTVVTIQMRDTLTVVTAAPLNGPAMSDTLKNLANNRFVHPARPKQ